MLEPEVSRIVATAPAPEPPPAVPASLTAEVFTSAAAARRVVDDWKVLHEKSGSRNPFADPTWALAWAEHFVADGDLFVVAVRDCGRLSCVAPFHRRRIGKGPLRFARSLQLLGAVEHVVLTDRPQILTGGASDRRALRRVVQMIQTDTDWDWFELPLAADQGWFEPNWIDASSPAKPFVVQKTSRPSVGMDLPDNLDALQSGLKRNLRESLRRARNRLNRGAAWRIEVVSDPADFDAAVERMMALHGARAAMRDTVAHADVFARAVDRDFARDALVRMAGERRAEALFVNVDGRRVAGLMTLLTPTCVSMCFSGVEPDWWSYSAVTLLQWEAVRRAVAAGRTYADFSVGVDVAKLRWSEKVSIHPEFVVVSGRRRSEIAFGAYFVAAAAARAMRERARYRGRGSRRSVSQSAGSRRADLGPA